MLRLEAYATSLGGVLTGVLCLVALVIWVYISVDDFDCEWGFVVAKGVLTVAITALAWLFILSPWASWVHSAVKLHNPWFMDTHSVVIGTVDEVSKYQNPLLVHSLYSTTVFDLFDGGEEYDEVRLVTVGFAHRYIIVKHKIPVELKVSNKEKETQETVEATKPVEATEPTENSLVDVLNGTLEKLKLQDKAVQETESVAEQEKQ